MSAPDDDLRKSADDLITDKQQLINEGGSTGNPGFNTRKEMEALRKFACVLTVTSRAADRQTRRIVGLTWALVLLTIALLTFTVFLYKDTHTLIQHDQTQVATPTPGS